MLTRVPMVSGVALATLLLVGGCNSAASIDVGGLPMFLNKKGQTKDLDVKIKDSSGNVLSGQTVAYRSLKPEIASVSPAGVVTAMGSGRTKVLIELDKLSKTVDVSVSIADRLGVDPENPTMNVGIHRGMKVNVFNEHGRPVATTLKVRWASSAPDVVSVDDKGNIKTIKEGKAVITAHAGALRGTSVITVKHEDPTAQQE